MKSFRYFTVKWFKEGVWVDDEYGVRNRLWLAFGSRPKCFIITILWLAIIIRRRRKPNTITK